MTAAMTLKDAGFSNMTVYEASDHVGGRTYTRKDDGFWEPGQWTEWGGELVDSAHDLMFALCDRFGFGTIDLTTTVTPGSSDVLYFGGSYYRWSDMVRDWEHAGMDNVIAADMANLPDFPWAYNDPGWTPAGIALDNMSLYDWIETRVPGGHHSRLGQFIDVAYAIEYGEDTRRQGATDLLGLLGFPTGDPFWIYAASDERYKIVGGNQQISLAQADYLGGSNMRLGWSLTSLARNRDGTLSATFDVGSGRPQTVTADHVILAIPLGVMKRLKAAGAFSQAFNDPRKSGLIDALGFGADNKLQLQISDRFWTNPGPWGTAARDGDAGSPLQRVLARGHVDDRESADVRLALRVRAVGDRAIGGHDAHLFVGAQSAAEHPDAGALSARPRAPPRRRRPAPPRGRSSRRRRTRSDTASAHASLSPPAPAGPREKRK